LKISYGLLQKCHYKKFNPIINYQKQSIMKKNVFTLVVLLMSAITFAQPPGGGGGGGTTTSGASVTIPFKTAINGKWKFNSTSNVYYMVGVYYCGTPAAATYEQMGIFVPGAFMNATLNSDGATYTCTINPTATVNGYTASSAPIVIPVNTGGYAAMSAPSDYTASVATYTAAGYVYLWPGCRGRTHGAPLGVTDLKAATRYYRYLQTEQNAVPGNTDRIFSFGMSGGGAQSAIFGASGNNSGYDAYLTAIGAVTGYKDDICGSMCWCPVTSLEQADAAHEWNMGLTRTGLATADANISKALAAEFATYVNAVGLKHPTTGNALTLTATDNGYYQSGSYYEYIMSVINESVTHHNSINNASVATYSTTDNTALYSFASTYKKATKGLGAFDNYASKSALENTLFGIAGVAGHFDKFLGEAVSANASSYSASFTADLASTNVDVMGNSVEKRLMLYSPLYYLVNNTTYYNNGGTTSSDVAPFWRIRSGINQSDTPLNTEINLALSLKNDAAVKDVDFATVWGQAHVWAEDLGEANSTPNFIAWVKKCVPASSTGLNINPDNEVKAYSVGKVIYINGNIEGGKASLFKIDGTNVGNYTLTNAVSATLNQSQQTDGVYILRVNNGEKVYSFKVGLHN